MVSSARECSVCAGAGEGYVHDFTFEVVMIKNCAIHVIELVVTFVHLSASKVICDEMRYR